jgi:hypothetical protein
MRRQSLCCLAIRALMGNVEGDQRWGLGLLPDSRFKGGWGPSLSGDYLVRQMGLVQTSRGMTAVALAAAPASGLFDDGTKISRQLPTGCLSTLVICQPGAVLSVLRVPPGPSTVHPPQLPRPRDPNSGYDPQTREPRGSRPSPVDLQQRSSR